MAKQTTRAGMDVKEKMYLVLVLCFAAVLITVGAAFFIVRGLEIGRASCRERV